ncbi:MAG: hypothetical protein PF549_01235 [Patescibacteria group bacterium]|jgi:hypothetical protein|nr:hypothetical protein [Patescibacteria group bacterium]
MLKKRNKNIQKKRETILSLYFGWRLRIILERTTQKLRGPFKTHKQYLVATLTLIFIISGSLIVKNHYFSKAATYEWLQTSWTTGETTNTHTHTNEQASPGTWDEYQSADSNLDFSTEGEVSISPTTETLTHESETDFSNGISTGVTTTGGIIQLDLP